MREAIQRWRQRWNYGHHKPRRTRNLQNLEETKKGSLTDPQRGWSHRLHDFTHRATTLSENQVLLFQSNLHCGHLLWKFCGRTMYSISSSTSKHSSFHFSLHQVTHKIKLFVFCGKILFRDTINLNTKWLWVDVRLLAINLNCTCEDLV